MYIVVVETSGSSISHCIGIDFDHGLTHDSLSPEVHNLATAENVRALTQSDGKKITHIYKVGACSVLSVGVHIARLCSG